jgi:hypothetical protein
VVEPSTFEGRIDFQVAACALDCLAGHTSEEGSRPFLQLGKAHNVQLMVFLLNFSDVIFILFTLSNFQIELFLFHLVTVKLFFSIAVLFSLNIRSVKG